MEWSKEYYGLSHLGSFSIHTTWYTVQRINDIALLKTWYPGCKFSPQETIFDSVEEAKTHAENLYPNSQGINKKR